MAIYQIFIVNILEELQEVLLHFPQIKDIQPSAQIEDLHLLKDIAGRCGYKVRTVAPPTNDEKQEVVSKMHKL